MFSKATANFVRQIDPEGSLIHVSRVNDSQKLVPMALVVKRNRIWFWQKPKYQPTDFTLGDLLQDGKVLSPGVSETEFLSYEGTFGDQLSAAMDTEAGPINVTVQGRGSSQLQSCFGKLKKEELDVKKLLRESSNRPVDMQHVLVQQLERRAEVLAVVKERILTTNPCSITQKKTEQCSFHGMLKLAGMLSSSVQVCVKDGTGIEVDSDVSLEIPSGTVIAYSILELEIKKNGHYDICLQPGTVGGIESDIPVLPWPSHESLDMADGKCNLSSLQNGSQDMDLSPLEQLPQPSRCDVFKRLQEILRDRPALSCLQYVLEELCSGETPTMQQELSESQTQSVSAILDRLVTADGHDESSRCGMTAYLNAAHLLVSALEELPDETLSLLSDSSPESLEAFDTLMCMLKESGAQVSIQCPPLLQDNQAFQLAEQLLRSVGVALRRHGDGLWMEAGNTAGVVLMVLCLSTHGLSLLCKGLK